MENNNIEKKNIEKFIRDYDGHCILTANLSAKMYNDITISEHCKAFIWFDRNCARIKEMREWGSLPWRWRFNEEDGSLEPPLLDFLLHEEKWPRHIRNTIDMEKFMFIVDNLYHRLCLSDLIELRDLPENKYGKGHVGLFTKKKCSYAEVMKLVFGILEHFDQGDFNVLKAEQVCSLMQTGSDQQYGEGCFLFDIGAYLNHDPKSPYIWSERRSKKETNFSVGGTKQVIIKLPEMADDLVEYRNLGDLKNDCTSWHFSKKVEFDAVILKCSGNSKNLFHEGNEELTVNYNDISMSIQSKTNLMKEEENDYYENPQIEREDYNKCSSLAKMIKELEANGIISKKTTIIINSNPALEEATSKATTTNNFKKPRTTNKSKKEHDSSLKQQEPEKSNNNIIITPLKKAIVRKDKIKSMRKWAEKQDVKVEKKKKDTNKEEAEEKRDEKEEDCVGSEIDEQDSISDSGKSKKDVTRVEKEKISTRIRAKNQEPKSPSSILSYDAVVTPPTKQNKNGKKNLMLKQKAVMTKEINKLVKEAINLYMSKLKN